MKTMSDSYISVEINLCVQPDAQGLLDKTLRAFNEAATFCSSRAVGAGVFSSLAIQRAFYSDLRTIFGLSAQHACLCCKEVAAKFSDRDKKPSTFRPFASIPFDARTFTLAKDLTTVSLTTLSGRVKIPARCGARQKKQLVAALKLGEARLIRHKNGTFAMRIACQVPPVPESPPQAWLGVDLGIVNLATDGDGHRHTGVKVECVRTEYAKTRKRLQKAAAEKTTQGKRPKNICKKLKKTSGKESRFMKDVNHQISKELVTGAQGTGRGIALEDLTGIRDRNRLGKQTRARVNRWAFAQLRAFITYKALLAGVALELVDPRGTSRECRQCGYTDKRNRKTQAEFHCLACGHTAHADKNAAGVIGKRAAVNRPIVSRSA